MPYKDPGKRAACKRAWRQAHPDYHRAYRKAHPEQGRAYEEGHREERRTYSRIWGHAYRATHREERRACERTWRQANREIVAEFSRRYRALKRGATIGLIDIEAIKVRDRMLCAICGKRVAEKDLSLDHTVPLSLGGAHSQENLRIAHLHCNKKRGAGRLPVQIVLC